jgi:hypothetical protein
MRSLTSVDAELIVEATKDGDSLAGRVIAVAIEGDTPAGEAPSPAATWLLVVDDRRPAPVWVSQSDVSAQRLGR